MAATESWRAWAAKNPDKIRANKRRHYHRNKDAILERMRAKTETLAYAKRLIRQETGLSTNEIPDDLAEAKLHFVRVRRLVGVGLKAEALRRRGQGQTVREIAEELSLDRETVARAIRDAGMPARLSEVSCKRGHIRTTENSYVNKHGVRICRVCARERQAEYQARKNK